MNFTFVNFTAIPSLWIKVLKKSIKNKSASLTGFKIVCEVFLKSLSIYLKFRQSFSMEKNVLVMVSFTLSYKL